jgi:[glutamine synthetase] adenylyltransferase / [glutamine synthetase]-adenylyl-L-tyrosine phosphorylase
MSKTLVISDLSDLPASMNKGTALLVLQRMADRHGKKFKKLLPRLLAAIASAADPDRSLIYLERFSEVYGNGKGIFFELEKKPRLIDVLITLFSTSQFLTEILLKNPEALHILIHRQTMTERKPIEKILEEALYSFRNVPNFQKLDALRRYQRVELLRIGTSDFLNLYDLRTVASQLSRLAIGLVQASLVLAVEQTGISSDGFVVIALGKLGGRELNYSSDIDLLFFSREQADKYTPLAERLVEIITRSTQEGFMYRVDMRLRPWGHVGPLVSTLAYYQKYLENNARLWEKQALLKCRPIAGDIKLGDEFRRSIEPHVFGSPPDDVRANVLSIKQRTERFSKAKRSRMGGSKTRCRFYPRH